MDRPLETSRRQSRSPTNDKEPEQIIPLSSTSGIAAGSPVFTALPAPIRSDAQGARPVSRESGASSSSRHAPVRQPQPISHSSYTPSTKLESVESPSRHTESGSSSSHPLPPLPVTNTDQRVLGEGTPITPLPRAIPSSRNTATLDANDEADNTFHQSPYNISSAVARLRRASFGPDQTLERPASAMMPLSTRSGTGTIVLEDKVGLHLCSTDSMKLNYLQPYREKTVAERLEPTLRHAIAEKNSYSTKARLTGYALNIAIGLQILLGTLTTSLSVILRGSSEVSIFRSILLHTHAYVAIPNSCGTNE